MCQYKTPPGGWPSTLCKEGRVDGTGIAISDGGRWIINDGQFSGGRLISGKRQSFSLGNLGYVGGITDGVANGWGYQRDSSAINRTSRYYRGGYKDGERDAPGRSLPTARPCTRAAHFPPVNSTAR